MKKMPSNMKNERQQRRHSLSANDNKVKVKTDYYMY